MTVAPRSTALVATQSASRVLPMPGSPAMRQSRPRPLMASPSAASSRARSRSRPTNSSAAARSISSRNAVGGGDASGDMGDIPSAVPVRRSLGDVRAEDPGADCVLEVETESRMLGGDPRDRLADAAGDGLARPVARVRGLARPAAEPVGGRQLFAQELDLRAELLGSSSVGPLGRLGELGLQVLEPLAVRGARGRVEHLARVAETGDDLAGDATARGLGLAAGGEVGTVELLTRVPQKAGDVLQALRVLQPETLPVVSDPPDVAVSAKDRRGCGRRPRFGGRRDTLSLDETGRGLEREHVRLERLHPDLAGRRE